MTEEAFEQIGERTVLALGLAAVLHRRGERGSVVTRAAELTEEPVEGVTEAGRVPHGSEVAVVLRGHLAGHNTVAERRKRSRSARDHRALAESERDVAGREEVNVDNAAAELGQAPSEIWPQERSADQNTDGRERLICLGGDDLVRECLLERGRRRLDEAQTAHRSADSQSRSGIEISSIATSFGP